MIKKIIFFNFSWEGCGTPPQNSYKPSQDLRVATLLRRTRSVQRLSRSFGTNILLLYYKDYHLFDYFFSLHTMARLCKKGGIVINSMSLQYTHFVEEYMDIHSYIQVCYLG